MCDSCELIHGFVSFSSISNGLARPDFGRKLVLEEPLRAREKIGKLGKRLDKTKNFGFCLSIDLIPDFCKFEEQKFSLMRQCTFSQ